MAIAKGRYCPSIAAFRDDVSPHVRNVTCKSSEMVNLHRNVSRHYLGEFCNLGFRQAHITRGDEIDDDDDDWACSRELGELGRRYGAVPQFAQHALCLCGGAKPVNRAVRIGLP